MGATFESTCPNPAHRVVEWRARSDWAVFAAEVDWKRRVREAAGVEVNGKTEIPPDAVGPVAAQREVEEAVRLGADAVGYTLYVGTPAQEADFEQYRRVRDDAQRLGMPLIVWAYPGQDYVPRFGWVDRHTLWMETLMRDQRHRYIDFVDVGSGQGRQVLEISDDKFLDDNYDVSVEDGNIVLTNWRDGHNHIYLYRYDAANPMKSAVSEPKQLTSGAWDVTAVSLVDAAKKRVFYASNEANPLEQQLWQVTFDGQRTPLTSEAGYHDGNFAPGGAAYVDKYSTRMAPPRLSLCQVGGKCNVFWSNRSLEPYKLRDPEPLEVAAKDGSKLYATVLLPAGDSEPESVPLIVNPYGGPGPADRRESVERFAAVRRTAGPAWFRRAARRQSRNREPRPRFCAGRLP